MTSWRVLLRVSHFLAFENFGGVQLQPLNVEDTIAAIITDRGWVRNAVLFLAIYGPKYS